MEKGKGVAVYVGICSNDYNELLTHYHVPYNNNPYFAVGNTHSTATGRISSLFNLTGPSVAFDSACSSSGVALHYAVKDLTEGECEVALVAGSNLILSPSATGAFKAAKMLSPQYRCNSFSKTPSGYVRAEAVIAMVIKPLEIAVSNGDDIYCVIDSTYVNQDGYTASLTSPNYDSQVKCLRKAIERAGLSAGDIDYVEAHGTGTVVGDQAEIESLNAVFGASASNPYLGSSKTLFGHTETCSSLTGILHAAEIIRRGSVPKYLIDIKSRRESELVHLQFANIEESIFGELHATVSGYGYSGTNFVCVISAPPKLEAPKVKSADTCIYLSGYSPKHIYAQIKQLEGNLLSGGDIEHLNLRQAYFPYRGLIYSQKGKVVLGSASTSNQATGIRSIYLDVPPCTDTFDFELIERLLASDVVNVLRIVAKHAKSIEDNRVQNNALTKILYAMAFLQHSGIVCEGINLSLELIQYFPKKLYESIDSLNLSGLVTKQLSELMFDASIYVAPTSSQPILSSPIKIRLNEVLHNRDQVLTNLHMGGARLNLKATAVTQKTSVPPFINSTFWFDLDKLNQAPLNHCPIKLTPMRQRELRDHLVGGRMVVPFSFYLASLFEHDNIKQKVFPTCFSDLVIQEPLLECSDKIQFTIEFGLEMIRFLCSGLSRPLQVFSANPATPSDRPSRIVMDCYEPLAADSELLYATLSNLSIQPGNSLRRIGKLYHRNHSDIVATIDTTSLNVAFDCAFQLLIEPFRRFASEFISTQQVFLPATIGKLTKWSDSAPHFVRVKPIRSNLLTLFYEVFLYDRDGQCIVHIHNLCATKHGINKKEVLGLYVPTFTPKDIQNQLQADIPSNVHTMLISKDEVPSGMNSLFTFIIEPNIPVIKDVLDSEDTKEKPLGITFQVDSSWTFIEYKETLVGLLECLDSHPMSTFLQLVSSGVYRTEANDNFSRLFHALQAWLLSITFEYPSIGIKYVEVSGSSSLDLLQYANKEMCAFTNTVDNQDPIVLYQLGVRYVKNVARSQTHYSLFEFEGGRLKSKTSKSNLCLEDYSPKVSEGVQIRVISTSVNFRDLLIVNQTYPAPAPEPGSDFFGQVISDSYGYQAGEFVIGLSGGAFTDYLFASPQQLVRVPKQFVSKGLASLPLVFLSAYIPIDLYLGPLAGKTALVHSASGGLGLTLISLLRHAGAEIFATAHGVTKKAYLKNIGIKHVADSRSEAIYFPCIKIDCVFYTLQPSLIEFSVSNMAEHSTFIDYTLSAKSNGEHIKSIGRDIRYIHFHLSSHLTDHPVDLNNYLPQVFSSHVIKELPVTCWSLSQTISAFDTLTESTHIGKHIIQRPSVLARPVIIIAGGAGDLASLLLDKHAQGYEYILIGRKSIDTINLNKQARFSRLGVRYIQADVGSLDSLKDVAFKLGEITQRITRIYHFAGSVINSTAVNSDNGLYKQLSFVKYEGAKNLQAVFDSPSVDYFVLAGSAASLFGSPGQSDYAAANAELDSFYSERMASGLPTKLIYFPPVEGTNMIKGLSALTRKVSPPIPANEFVGLFERALVSPAGKVSFGELSIEYTHSLPSAQQTLIQSLLSSSTETDAPDVGLNEVLSCISDGLTVDEQQAALLEFITEIAITGLQFMEAESCDPHKALSEQGVDSLAMVELAGVIEDHFSISLAQEAFDKQATLWSIATLVHAVINEREMR